MDSINKRQFALMACLLPLVFKVATLPRLIAEDAGRDCYFAIAIMAVVECIMLIIIVNIHRNGGISAFKKAVGKVGYAVITLPLLLVYGAKSIVYIAEATDYIANSMFYNITNYKVLIMLALIVLFVASRGFKGIGRSIELIIWLSVLIVAVGLCFGEVELNFGNLLPILGDGIKPVANSLYKFMFWGLDLTPLLFVKVADINNKRPYILVAGAIMVGFATFVYMVFVANYGGSVAFINNAFARLATFNVVNTEIGSIDWPSIVMWIAMAVMVLATNAIAGGRVLAQKGRFKQGAVGFFVAVVAIVAGYWLYNVDLVLDFATSWLRYAVVAVQIVVPIIILIVVKCKRCKYEKVA